MWLPVRPKLIKSWLCCPSVHLADEFCPFCLRLAQLELAQADMLALEVVWYAFLGASITSRTRFRMISPRLKLSRLHRRHCRGRSR